MNLNSLKSFFLLGLVFLKPNLMPLQKTNDLEEEDKIDKKPLPLFIAAGGGFLSGLASSYLLKLISSPPPNTPSSLANLEGLAEFIGNSIRTQNWAFDHPSQTQNILKQFLSGRFPFEVLSDYDALSISLVEGLINYLKLRTLVSDKDTIIADFHKALSHFIEQNPDLLPILETTVTLRAAAVKLTQERDFHIDLSDIQSLQKLTYAAKNTDQLPSLEPLNDVQALFIIIMSTLSYYFDINHNTYKKIIEDIRQSLNSSSN